MATLYPVSRLIKDLVQEKETRMRETAAAMGMHLAVNAFAWWLTSAALFFLLAVVTSFVAKASFFPRSDFTILLAYFGSLLLSEVALAFLVAACFSRARLASIVGPVVLFAFVLPRYIFFGTDRNENVEGKKWASLSSIAAFCFGADVFADYEYAEIGVGWTNAFEGEYSLMDCIGFMVFDSFLYLTLAAYLETVAPTEHGSPRHPLFFLQPLWRKVATGIAFLLSSLGYPAAARRLAPSASVAPPHVALPGDEAAHGSAGVHGARDEEPVPAMMGAPAVTIDGLVKDYHHSTLNCFSDLAIFIWTAVGPFFGSARSQSRSPARPRAAVDGLTLSLWPGQVTCLLGHNGAGKSTTVSVLTGLTPPTAGSISVLGRNLQSDLAGVRGTVGLGVCPQTNVVFDSLTVEEHLDFFAKIKGVGADLNWFQGRRARAAAVAAAVSDVGLTEKRNYRAAALSGGQKRKLCLAMALIGDPKVVYLDEPTSGMDPYSRRATWELVRRAKQNRVVVLTTHFMDEAEVLGDRVAIMARGRLRCVGSALWLKARFGLGYRLIVTTTRAIGKSSGDLQSAAEFQVAPANAAAEPAIAQGTPALGARAQESKQIKGGSQERKQHNLPPLHLSESTGQVSAVTAAEAAVRQAVALSVPAATFSGAVAREVTFRLPSASASAFPALLELLDKMKEHVSAYSLAVTTLEEVFVKVAEDDEEDRVRGNAASGEDENESRMPVRVEGDGGKVASVEMVGHINSAPQGTASTDIPPDGGQVSENDFLVHDDEGRSEDKLSFCQEIFIQVNKRFTVFKRDRKSAFFQLGVPILLIIGILSILTIRVAVSGVRLES